MLKEEKFTLWKIAAVCIGLALPMRLFGPAAMAVLLGFGVLAGLVATKGNSLRSSVRVLQKSTVARLSLLWLGVVLLSAVFSIDPSYSLMKFTELFAVFFLSLMLYLVLREMPVRYVYTTLGALCVGTLVAMGLSISDAFLSDERLAQALHGERWSEAERLSFMSAVFGVILPFTWAWLLKAKREQEPWARHAALPLGLLSFIAVAACGGKAGWLTVCIVLVIFLLKASKHHHLVLHRQHWLAGALVAVLAPVAYLFAKGGVAGVKQMAFGSFSPHVNYVDVWKFSFENMAANPITGIGLQAFRTLEEGAMGTHSYNFLIQILLETGILGLAVTFVIVWKILAYFSKAAKSNLYGLAGFCSVLGFFIASLGTTSIFHSWWIAFLIFPALFAWRIGWVGKK